MIPAGRTAVRADESAAQFGVSMRTWMRRVHDERYARSWPAIISSERAGVVLADQAQVRALLLGERIPPLPTVPDDGDLLDRYEAVEILVKHAMTPRVWATRAARPNDSLPAADVTIHGVPHWFRRTIRAWDEEGRHKPPGRPTGTTGVGYNAPKQRAAAEQRAARVLAELEQSDRPSAREVAARLGISERTVERIVRAAREAAS